MSRIGERRHLRHVISEADGEVYGKYADELIRFATGVVGPDDAPDAVSTAVLRTFTSPSWSSVTNQRAYLYRAVLNECRQIERSRRRRVGREQRDARSRPMPDHDDPDVQPEVRDAVEELALRPRAVLVLTYWADLPPEEIATLLGVSSRTVRRDLDASHRRLRRSLRD
jgi:RNA polymerase sigma-70 factor (ECF subfamily)